MSLVFERISIIGDGAMGTVLSMILCGKGFDVRLWGHDADLLARTAASGENTDFFPGYPLPESLVIKADDSRIFDGAQLVVSAVPCQFTRGVWQRLKRFMPGGVPVVSVTKGIENRTLLRPSMVISEVLSSGGGDLSRVYAVLSGPTIADELARSLPATACLACRDIELAGAFQQVFSTGWFRVYTNSDLVGVELAGALKNVIAIAAGIIDGTGAGDNAKAALLTRGLAEITRLGLACGAMEKTFSGLAGLGDLVTTCISPRGRNRSFGERLGRLSLACGDSGSGGVVEGAISGSRAVIEGIATCRSVVDLARCQGVDMPITSAVHAVLFEKKSVRAAFSGLMERRLRAE
jgi:glycerol-3-phosphate dehydrogenase (NAD(P)+)